MKKESRENGCWETHLSYLLNIFRCLTASQTQRFIDASHFSLLSWRDMTEHFPFWGKNCVRSLPSLSDTAASDCFEMELKVWGRLRSYSLGLCVGLLASHPLSELFTMATGQKKSSSPAQCPWCSPLWLTTLVTTQVMGFGEGWGFSHWPSNSSAADSSWVLLVRFCFAILHDDNDIRSHRLRTQFPRQRLDPTWAPACLVCTSDDGLYIGNPSPLQILLTCWNSGQKRKFATYYSGWKEVRDVQSEIWEDAWRPKPSLPATLWGPPWGSIFHAVPPLSFRFLWGLCYISIIKTWASMRKCDWLDRAGNTY